MRHASIRSHAKGSSEGRETAGAGTGAEEEEDAEKEAAAAAARNIAALFRLREDAGGAGDVEGGGGLPLAPSDG